MNIPGTAAARGKESQGQPWTLAIPRRAPSFPPMKTYLRLITDSVPGEVGGDLCTAELLMCQVDSQELSHS